MFLASPIEEVTDALSGKGVQFLMQHDIELQLPDMIFDGATFRISPRTFDGTGALVKMEFIPKAVREVQEAGRILFKPLKKLSKYFSMFLNVTMCNNAVMYYLQCASFNYFNEKKKIPI